MDRFNGVRRIFPAAVFGRRLRPCRYMMTAVTTVRRNELLPVFRRQLRLSVAQKRLQSICGAQERRFRATLLVYFDQ